jgi:hypothetical protein
MSDCRATAAKQLREAMRLIGQAAGGPLRELAPSEYFEINRLWIQCGDVAERLERLENVGPRRPPQQERPRRK